MNEWRRIIFSSRHICIVVLLILLAVIFSFDAGVQEEDVEYGYLEFETEEKESYVEKYNHFYMDMVENAEELMGVRFYKDEEGFSYKNIQKTLEDYADIAEWKIEERDTTVETLYFSYKDYSYLMLVYVFVLGSMFQEFDKKSIGKVIRATKRGRAQLTLWRCGIIFCCVTMLTLVLYGVRAVSLLIQYGRGLDFTMPIQNIEVFFYIPFCYSVGDFLVRILIEKIVAMTILGCLIWFIQKCIGHVVASAVCLFALYGVEYALYTGMSDNSAWVILKYLNMMHWIEPTQLHETYLNLDVFGIPVSIMTLCRVFGVILCLVVVLGLVYLAEYRYPVITESRIKRFMDKLKRPFFALVYRIRHVGLESYKLLFPQNGIWALVLLVVFLFTYEGVSIRFMSFQDVVANGYYEQYEGRVDANLLSELEVRLSEEAAKRQNVEYNSDYYNALQQVYENARILYAEAEDSGRDAYLLSPYAYQSVLGNSSEIYHLLQAAKIVAVIVLFSATMFAYERERNMRYLVHTTHMGDKSFFRRKVLIGWGWISVFSILFWGQEIVSAAGLWSGFSGWHTSACNLLFLESRVDIPIIVMLLFLYVNKLCICTTIYFICITVSTWIKKSRTSLMVLFLGFEIPIVLTYFSKDFSFVSIANLFEVEFLLHYGVEVMALCVVASVTAIVFIIWSGQIGKEN